MAQIKPTSVAGAAVYLEFVKPSMTTQVLIMPEGTSASARVVPMSMYRRRLSRVQPRKSWKMSSAHQTSASARMRSVSATTGELTQNLLSFANPLLESLVKNGWTLYGDPIVVEVTAEDLELYREAKTPYKVLGRVIKVRKALGFPKDIVHPHVPTSAPAE